MSPNNDNTSATTTSATSNSAAPQKVRDCQRKCVSSQVPYTASRRA
jgi:hypothetical protein